MLLFWNSNLTWHLLFYLTVVDRYGDSHFTFHTMKMKWQGKKSNKVATVCLKRSGLSQIKALVLQPLVAKSYGIFGLLSLSPLWFKFVQNDTFTVFHFQAKAHIKWRNSYTNGIEILIRLKIDFSGHNHSLIFNLQNCGYTIKIQSGQWHMISSSKIMKHCHHTMTRRQSK